jgi:hypothetical protein
MLQIKAIAITSGIVRSLILMVVSPYRVTAMTSNRAVEFKLARSYSIAGPCILLSVLVKLTSDQSFPDGGSDSRSTAINRLSV